MQNERMVDEAKSSGVVGKFWKIKINFLTNSKQKAKLICLKTKKINRCIKNQTKINLLKCKEKKKKTEN